MLRELYKCLEVSENVKRFVDVLRELWFPSAKWFMNVPQALKVFRSEKVRVQG